MHNYQTISVLDAWQLLQHKEQHALLVDIRDLATFLTLHPPSAVHLHQHNFSEVCDSLEFDQPILVLCYHGISSHGVAQHLANYGFEQVYSVDGGFAAWQQLGLPVESGSASC